MIYNSHKSIRTPNIGERVYLFQWKVKPQNEESFTEGRFVDREGQIVAIPSGTVLQRTSLRGYIQGNLRVFLEEQSNIEATAANPFPYDLTLFKADEYRTRKIDLSNHKSPIEFLVMGYS